MKMREAFEGWKDYQLANMKSGGHNKFWAKSVYFGDLQYAFEAGYQAAIAAVREGGVIATMNPANGALFPFIYDGSIPLYKLPEDEK